MATVGFKGLSELSV